MTFSRKFMAGGIFVVLGVAAACGKSSDDDSTPATGGSAGKGGSSATGGTKSSGGTGGSTGGTKSTGGTTSTGGSSEAGGTGGTAGKGGSGGTTSTSGTGGTGDPVAIDSMCASFTACGGDVVGTWKPTKLCSSATDMGAAGGAGGTSGLPECASNTQMNMASSDALYTFESDGTYSVSGSLTVAASFTVDDACAMDQGAPDAASFCALASLFAGSASGLDVTCKMAGGVCGCVFGSTQDQSSTGTYTIDGDSITIEQNTGTTSQAEGTHDFCVKNATLTLSNTAGEQFVLTKQ